MKHMQRYATSWCCHIVPVAIGFITFCHWLQVSFVEAERHQTLACKLCKKDFADEAHRACNVSPSRRKDGYRTFTRAGDHRWALPLPFRSPCRRKRGISSELFQSLRLEPSDSEL